MNDVPLTSHRDDRFAVDHPLRILIAEDNDASRLLLKTILRGLGYEPQETTNGRECFEAVIRGPFDLLLVDLDMPEMNGIDCVAHIRRAGLRIPIIAVTAAGHDIQNRFQAVGMNGYLPKPLVPVEVKRTLREVCLRKWVDEHHGLLSGYSSWALSPDMRPENKGEAPPRLRSLVAASATGPLAR